jgi:hypothetical protein
LLFFFAPATTLRRAVVVVVVVGRRCPGVQRAAVLHVVVVVVVVVVAVGDDVDVRGITAVRMACSRAGLSLSWVRPTSSGRARVCEDGWVLSF